MAGAGLSRGYLNRPELTNERFINNVVSDEKSERLYKSGDLARYLANGDIEYLGRIDHQVQIRGFRIELGEIESLLSQHEAVHEVAVSVHEQSGDDKRLVAYVVGTIEHSAAEGELRRFLKERLPEYMVPSAFIILNKLPLTNNGKVDRAALPIPEGLRSGARKAPIPPRDVYEQRLLQIWQDMFKVHPIGVRDNFFEIGGHSLLAVRLITQIRQEFRLQLPVTTVLQAPTIEALADLLRRKTRSPIWSPLVQICATGESTPFFCVAGGGGSVLYYYPLAHALIDERPFYGLQARGLDGDCEPLTRL